MTKYHPILFNAAMVRAILDGRKTQTRRPMKPQPAPYGGSRIWWQFSKRSSISCAVGDTAYTDWIRYLPWAVGDRLWVRETWSAPYYCNGLRPSELSTEGVQVWYWADGNPTDGDWTKPKPSIHMPRWASRILLEVTNVRVQRLQDISEEDARAEGATRPKRILEDDGTSYTDGFATIWEDIYGRKPGLSWDDNPWVVATTFEKVAP